MIKFKTFLEEGINDPAIFKAVFLAGGPGSGKSFVVGKTALQSLGFRLINSDDAFERALDKAGLSKSNPDDIFSPQGQALRGQAKALTGKKMELAIDGRLGLVIDGTGKDANKIRKQVDSLRGIGYSVKMIFVNTDLETALERNRQRERTLPDATVEKMWNEVQRNVNTFQSFFGNRFIMINNSLSNEKTIQQDFLSAYRKVSAWAKTPPESRIAKDWINQQKQQRGIREDIDARLKDRHEYETKSLENKMQKEKEVLKRKHDAELERAAREKESRDENLVKEAKASELYFDTYSAAINHALTATRKQFDIDPEDVADIVGLKSRRPSRGKTTSVSIPLYRRGTDKLDRKQLHIQVYNREIDRDPFELNFYVR